MDIILALLTQFWYLAAGLVFLAVGVPFVVNLLDGWRKKMDAVKSPMSITLHTTKTPAQLVSDAQFARFKRNLFFVVVVLVCWAGLHFVNAELAHSLDTFMYELAVGVTSALSRFFSSLSELLVENG